MVPLLSIGVAPLSLESLVTVVADRGDATGSDGGGGLGLPIARRVAQLHGGTLALESTGPGGSRFVAAAFATCNAPGNRP